MAIAAQRGGGAPSGLWLQNPLTKVVAKIGLLVCSADVHVLGQREGEREQTVSRQRTSLASERGSSSSSPGTKARGLRLGDFLASTGPKQMRAARDRGQQGREAAEVPACALR